MMMIQPRPNNHGRPASRRGIAALALVLLVAMLSLAIVGMVLGGARDQDLTVSRLETLRANYATEAGAQMAIRELMGNTDYDGDGAIGSISNDGVAGNNPTIGGASVYVDRAVSGSTVTLDVRGSTSVARRHVQVTAQTAVAASSATVVYAKSGSQTPVVRTWNGSAWSAESNTLDVGGLPRWIVAAKCPTRNEIIVATLDDQNDVNVMVHNGTSWGNLLEVTNNAPTNSSRCMSLAYEQVSGNAVVAYSKSGSSSVAYRTWNGTAWSSESTTTNGSTSMRWIRMRGRPGSNQIILLTLENSSDNAVRAMVWDGSAWGNKAKLADEVRNSADEGIAIAFESSSNDGLIAFADKDNDKQVRYRTWNGTSWSASATGPDADEEIYWISLAADPSTDRIMVITLDKDNEVHVAQWNGSAWGGITKIESGTNSTSRREMAVAYEPTGSRAVAMYAEGSLTTPRYRTFDGTNWSSELTGPNLGTAFASFAMVKVGTGRDILALGMSLSSTNALKSMRWNGSSVSSTGELTANVSGNDSVEAYAIIAGSSTANTASLTAIVAAAP